jgi:hypothetical protein
VRIGPDAVAVLAPGKRPWRSEAAATKACAAAVGAFENLRDAAWAFDASPVKEGRREPLPVLLGHLPGAVDVGDKWNCTDARGECQSLERGLEAANEGACQEHVDAECRHLAAHTQRRGCLLEAYDCDLELSEKAFVQMLSSLPIAALVQFFSWTFSRVASVYAHPEVMIDFLWSSIASVSNYAAYAAPRVWSRFQELSCISIGAALGFNATGAGFLAQSPPYMLEFYI